MPPRRALQLYVILASDIAGPDALFAGVCGRNGGCAALVSKAATQKEVKGAEDRGVGADDADVYFGEAPGYVGDGGPWRGKCEVSGAEVKMRMQWTGAICGAYMIDLGRSRHQRA